MALASSALTPAAAAKPSWNPLKFNGTELPTELLIMVKSLALVVLLTNHARILPDPWLPFVPGIDRIPPVLFQRTLQSLFVIAALALMFNRRVRLASGDAVSALHASTVSSDRSVFHWRFEAGPFCSRRWPGRAAKCLFGAGA